VNEGAELLYRTRHLVLSAPYHENVQGNLDAIRFFSTKDVAEAEKIAHDRHAELVVMCGKLESIYIGEDMKDVVFSKDGKPIENPNSSLAEQLVNGHVPDWLHRMENPFLKDYQIYEVRLK
jgi:hypothetical protein